MNTTQLYLVTWVPTLASLCTTAAVIFTTLLSRAQVNRICANIDRLCESGNSRQNAANAAWAEEKRAFHECMAKLESRD